MATTKDAPGAAKGEVEKSTSSKSMHDNVPVWYDCCSCEAEPYWAELAEVDSPDEARPHHENPDQGER